MLIAVNLFFLKLRMLESIYIYLYYFELKTVLSKVLKDLREIFIIIYKHIQNPVIYLRQGFFQ